MDILPIDIEVLDEDQVDEDDLTGFVETEPMQLGEEQHVIGSKIINKADEEELIKQFLDGKLSFSDYKCQVLDEEDDGSDVDVTEYIMGDEDDEVEDVRPSVSSSRFETELVNQRRDQLKGQLSKVSTGRVGRKKKSVLPPALQGLMGEANLRYARGDTEMAEKVCLEIIRQTPSAVEPFITLAQIYEGRDQEKYMQFMLIAGHLNPSDVEHWIQLAELSEEKGDIKQAFMCYSKAVKAAPHEIDIRLKRIELMKQLGDDKYVLKLQLYMIAYIKDPKFQLELAKEVAQKYHEMGAPERALAAFRSAHKENGDHFSVGDVNQYLELLIDSKMFADALNILCQHTQIEMQITPKTKDREHSIDAVVLPDDLIPDFRTKASICLIRLKCPSLHQYIIDEALKVFHVEDDGDCLLDIAEALIVVGHYEDALRLLEPLVESEKFSLAAVWLRYADCLRFLGETDRAIESYRIVVQMAPQHLDARLTLSALLKQKNQHAEALKALEQDLESDILDPLLLYEHCFMLKETGQIEQYIDLSGVLFSRHCLRFRNREEAEIAIHNRRVLDTRNYVKEYREFRKEDMEETEGPEFTKESDELDQVKEVELLEDVLKQCYYTGKYATMQKYSHQALTTKRFSKYRTQIIWWALVASIANKDYSLGSYHSKEILLKNPANRRAWNLYIATQQAPQMVMKYHRFLARWVTREPEKFEKEAHDWKGSYSLAAGTYLAAVKDFTNNFKRDKAPFSALLAAIGLSHLAVQKFVHHSMDYVNQSILYMADYAGLREREAEQEVYYNTARMYHQLGMMANAMDYYKKVLACDTHPDPKVAEIIDLKKEAAFNLHLIYKESGNLAMAKKLLFDNVVI